MTQIYIWFIVNQIELLTLNAPDSRALSIQERNGPISPNKSQRTKGCTHLSSWIDKSLSRWARGDLPKSEQDTNRLLLAPCPVDVFNIVLTACATKVWKRGVYILGKLIIFIGWSFLLSRILFAVQKLISMSNNSWHNSPSRPKNSMIMAVLNYLT